MCMLCSKFLKKEHKRNRRLFFTLFTSSFKYGVISKIKKKIKKEQKVVIKVFMKKKKNKSILKVYMFQCFKSLKLYSKKEMKKLVVLFFTLLLANLIYVVTLKTIKKI